MIGKLTSTERQYAAVVLVMLAAAGIGMAALGRNDTLGVHSRPRHTRRNRRPLPWPAPTGAPHVQQP